MKWQEIEVVEDDDGMMSTNERCTDVGKPSTPTQQACQRALIVYRRYQSFPHVTEETLGYI